MGEGQEGGQNIDYSAGYYEIKNNIFVRTE
jgi:hypothetical protein